MRLAFLMYFAPRKLGSMEGWLAALGREARRRGHEVDFYGMEPGHPGFVSELRELGVGWFNCRTLEKDFWGGVRVLSRYDVINLNMVEVRDRLALMAYAAWPARVVWVDHASGYYDPDQPARTSPHGLLAPASKLLDRLSAIRLDKVIGVSNYVRDRNQARFGLGEDRALTIYNGIDASRFSQTPRLFDSERVILTTVAHLIRQKGIHHLLAAVHRLGSRRLHLRVVGDGPELPKLREQARVLGLKDQVDFLGLRDDVNALVRSTDLFVHPAVWPEAFGLTITEAMAAGRPVIASRVGGIPEIIEHGENGLLVPPRDELALSAAIQRLMEHPEDRARLGEAARKRVEEAFTLERCVAEHLGTCESIVARARRSASKYARLA